MKKDNIYFANMEIEDIGQPLMEKIENYYNYITTTNRFDVWDKIHKQLHRGYYSKAQVKSVGKNKNKKEISINHFRNILQHIVILTTNDRPAYMPRAINSDYNSLAQVNVAKTLLDYYMTKKNLEDKITKIVEYAVNYGEGWILTEWDRTIGDVVASEDGEKMVRSGDIVFKIFTPHDIIRDPAKMDIDGQEWFIVAEEVNKFEYAAKYKEWEEEILALDITQNRRWLDNSKDDVPSPETDAVTLFTFVHKKTTAVPNGRLIKFFNEKIIVFNDELPYEDFPLVGIVPYQQDFSPFGYSISYDMLSVQDAADALASTTVTNQSAFGVQNIIVPKGAGIEESSLSGGLRLITYNSAAGEPKPLALLQTPPEVGITRNNYISELETISGVNSVARGNPEASLRSGNALALVHSTAVQFNRGLQRSYVRCLELVGTSLINVLKKYAKTPRVIKIAGVNNRQYIDEFKGSSISDIDCVSVDIGNPLTRTTAFKVDTAKSLLDMGLIKTPSQYFQVLKTGNLDTMTEGTEAELMLIKSENEALLRGETVDVVAIEDHALHVNEHKTVIYSPEAKKDAELVSNLLNHIQRHYEVAQTVDPGLLSMLGIQSMQAQPAQSAGAPNQSAPIEEALPSMPGMPQNPMTGETYNPEAGV